MASRSTGKVARELSAEEQAALARYAPKSVPADRWARIADYTRSAAAQAGGFSTRRVTAYIHIVARYVDWAHNVMGRSLVHEQIFEPELIAYYAVNGLENYSQASKSTARTALLWHADHLLPAEVRPLTIQRFGRHPRSAPHTADEIRRLKQWADEQHTPFKRHVAWTVLTFGFGAGLRTHELDALRREDVVEDEHGVLVHVRGKNARVIPMLAEWEDTAVVLADCVAPGAFIYKPERGGLRPADLGVTLSKTHARPDFPFNLGKMRTTWLVTLLNAQIPVQAVTAAAGLSGLTGLERLLDFVDPVPAEHYREALRAAWRTYNNSRSETQREIHRARIREDARRRRARQRAKFGGAHGR